LLLIDAGLRYEITNIILLTLTSAVNPGHHDQAMRYSKEHKDASRARLIELGGSHAKKHGFNESGMATLAASAGVTTGALYKHFDGKADLFAAVIAAELERTAKMYDGFDPGDDASAAKSLKGYLSLEHVKHPEQGCPLPSLTPEIARADDAAKATYQAGLLEIHAKLRRLTASSGDAWTLMAQNVGAVMLARAVPDEQLQREILAALRQAGEKLLADSPSRSISSRA
jgi:TetR/AcrR family transcriptional regulator, transcriptional repressor for nem operon